MEQTILSTVTELQRSKEAAAEVKKKKDAQSRTMLAPEQNVLGISNSQVTSDTSFNSSITNNLLYQ